MLISFSIDEILEDFNNMCVGRMLNTPEVCISEHVVPHHFVLFSNLKLIS